MIRGGQELSSYPSECVLSIERRTIPGETPATAKAELQQIVDRLHATDSAFKADVRTGLDRLPMEIAEESDIARAVQAAVTEKLGHPAEIAGVPFWTDAAILSQAGIPSLLFGPSGAGAHAVEEWVDLDSVRTCAEVYLAAASGFCA